MKSMQAYHCCICILMPNMAHCRLTAKLLVLPELEGPEPG